MFSKKFLSLNELLTWLWFQKDFYWYKDSYVSYVECIILNRVLE